MSAYVCFQLQVNTKSANQCPKGLGVKKTKGLSRVTNEFPHNGPTCGELLLELSPFSDDAGRMIPPTTPPTVYGEHH